MLKTNYFINLQRLTGQHIASCVTHKMRPVRVA